MKHKLAWNNGMLVDRVSILLEILDGATGRELHAPSVQEVSILLEILGLMCLVVVGF